MLMEKFKIIRRGGLENPYAKPLPSDTVEAEDLLKANEVALKKYGQEYVAVPADSENR